MTTTTVTLEVPIPGEVPDWVDTTWVARTFGLTTAAVNGAIRKGYIPARRAGHIYLMRPEDVILLWGWRLTAGKAKKAS